MNWQPIETVPKDGRDVVLLDCLPNAIAQVAHWKDRQWWAHYLNDEFDFESATHWALLPAKIEDLF